MKNKYIEDLIVISAKNFSSAVAVFYPAVDGNGFNERNISFQLAHTFVSQKEGSSAYMEVPFYNPENEKWDKHIDCFMLNKDIGIFLEAKRLYSIEKMQEIADDCHKLKKGVKAILNDKKQFWWNEKDKPQKIYCMVVGEVWVNAKTDRGKNIVTWWKTGEGAPSKEWEDCNNKFPEKAYYASHSVKDFDKEGDSWQVHWIYGYFEI
jgi:hypothetical protein